MVLRNSAGSSRSGEGEVVERAMLVDGLSTVMFSRASMYIWLCAVEVEALIE